MGRHGQRQLLRRDAAAVIDDPHQRHASLFELDVDPRGAGVERVLEEFLGDARRPLHHLAGGDPVDHRLWQFLDPWHALRARE